MSEQPLRHLIQPQHIDASGNPVARFGKHEAEKAAKVVLILCQRKGGWFSFTLTEFAAVWIELYGQPSRGAIGWDLVHLVDPSYEDRLYGWIKEKQGTARYILPIEGDTYLIREAFVDECFAQSPLRSPIGQNLGRLCQGDTGVSLSKVAEELAQLGRAISWLTDQEVYAKDEQREDLATLARVILEHTE